MSEINFKPGDIVRLKSGGPKMTVKRINSVLGADNGSYLCDWFNKATEWEHEHKSASFSAAQLESAN